MSGYFSQLAHHTGLSLERGANKSASSFAAEPTVAVQRPESGPLNPLHVEEIAFTSAPAPVTVESNSERRATLSERDRAAAGTTDVRSLKQTESKEYDHLQSAGATAKPSIDVSRDELWEESRIAFTDSASSTMNSPEHFAVENFPASKPPATRPDEASSAERRALSQESIAIPYDSIEMAESRSAARDPEAQGRQAPRPEAKDAGQPKPTMDRGPADAVRDQQVERETIVHNYLKEVRAWVSAPPELDQRELEWQRDAERSPAPHDAEQSLATHSDVFALEREVQSAAPRPARSESLEVQDLNLSIGTISIVIEEPKQIAPAAVQAPARVDSPRERPASEPTRLSRYYLGRW